MSVRSMTRMMTEDVHSMFLCFGHCSVDTQSNGFYSWRQLTRCAQVGLNIFQPVSKTSAPQLKKDLRKRSHRIGDRALRYSTLVLTTSL